MKYYMSLWVGLLMVSSAMAQNQEMMSALYAYHSTNEPQSYTTATNMLQDATMKPEALDYNLFDGSFVVGGFDGSGVSLLHSHNRIATQSISSDELRSDGLLRLGLRGASTTFGMWEISDPLLGHVEFADGGGVVRVIDADGPREDGNNTDRWHATHVAGTMVGRGANPAAEGVAPEATLHAYDIDDQFVELTELFVNDDAADDLQVSNHSYGRVAGWWTSYRHSNGVTYPVWAGNITVSTVEDYRFGYYDLNAQNIDEIVYAQQTFLPVWAAGNDRLEPNHAVAGNIYVGYLGEIGTVPPFFINGPYPPADGFPEGYDTLTGYAMAKNVLSVGAIEDLPGGWTAASNVVYASFSSAGPTDDGRIKPDLVANGVGVLSADDPSTSPINADADYFSYSGTSQAAPGVAATVNLLIEYAGVLNPGAELLRASMLKALLIHTADEAGAHVGPDYRGGFGVLNGMRAASILRANWTAVDSPYLQSVSVVNGGAWTNEVTALGGSPLKVTAGWTDPAGAVHDPVVDDPTVKLVNDLDVKVVGPDGVEVLPWVLDRLNPSAAATRGLNRLDNVEQVLVESPVAGGLYQVIVAPAPDELLVNESGESAAQVVSVVISGLEAVADSAAAELLLESDELGWSPLPGVVYHVETAAELAGSWMAVSNGVSFERSPVFTPIDRDGEESHRFWRVRRSE